MSLRVNFVFFARICAWFLGFLLLLCIAIFLFGISATTELTFPKKLSVENIHQAQKILYEGTKTKPDDLAAITLSESDLNLAGNYLLNRYFQSAIRVDLVNRKVRCEVSIKLSDNPLAKYFNISFRLGSESDETLPQIAKFKVGKLLLPAKFANWVVHVLIRYSFLNEYFILATTPIQQVKIDDKTLTIFYQANSQNKATNAQSRELYREKIAEIIALHDAKFRLSLADLLKPIFELAYQRSILETAIEENRSAIFALNDYVNGVKEPKKPPFLYKRIDLAQHFIGAATLTASMNSQVANAIGEVKELSDARAGGSGFSFIDLAADKAGSRFGELAVFSPESARRIQKLTSEIRDYRDFMPDPRDLPEHMSEREFKKVFESTQSPPYLKLAALIDARIAKISLYQNP
jgi:hypothetical protein